MNDILIRGGPVMYALFACSIFAFAIFLERLMFWIGELRRVPHEKVTRMLTQNNNSKIAESLPEDHLLQELCPALIRRDEELVKSILLHESERAYGRSVRHLSGLDTIVSIAPLLGILGTVLGIMKSFHGLDLKHLSSPGEVGHGLAEAMITTATGLMIAIPTLVAYNLFHSLATRHATRLQKLGEDFSFDSTNAESTPEGSQSTSFN